MLQDRIHKRKRAALVEQQVVAMPEYPIYHEPNGRYVIYIDGRRRVFDSEIDARTGQLIARAAWLRKQSEVS